MGVALLLFALLDSAIVFGADSAAVTAVLILQIVLVLAGYPIITEWLTRGRTVGKLVFGLRAVRDDGGPIAFRQALVRGLAGLILEKPGLLAPLTTIAGVVTISTSAREKRIGDMLAGTIVLNERSGPQVLAQPPMWVPPPLQPWVLSLDLHRLDDRLALSLRQFVTRAHGMSPTGQVALGEELRRRVLAVTSPPPPVGAPTPDVLLGVLAERRRRAETAERGRWVATRVAPWPGGPGQQAPRAPQAPQGSQPAGPFVLPS